MKLESVCALCERHKKLVNTANVSFWIEWADDGNAYLVLDPQVKGGAGAIRANYCPLCGKTLPDQGQDGGEDDA